MLAIWLQPFDMCPLWSAGLNSKHGRDCIAEKAVQRGNHLRPLADRAADPLDRAGAHVAHREDAGHGGFELRARTAEIELRLRAGDHEASTVERDAAAIEPAGGGIGADEKKQIADL